MTSENSLNSCNRIIIMPDSLSPFFLSNAIDFACSQNEKLQNKPPTWIEWIINLTLLL
jgi:hypothetical protein